MQNRIFLIIVAVLSLMLLSCAQTQHEQNQTSVNVVPDVQKSINSPPQNPMAPITWEYTDKWKALGTPPNCQEPFTILTPVPVDKVVSVLYPGQTRGNDYKPHGGFRFESTNNTLVVRAPFDGYVYRGSGYLENGEVQYLFEVIHPCGYLYRFDHLRELSPKFTSIAQKFGEPKADDSRTTKTEQVFVQTGEIVGTSIGFADNVFVDFGVYDLRKKNSYATHTGEQAEYAVCWLDLLDSRDSTRLKALPGSDQTNGKTSDYCK